MAASAVEPVSVSFVVSVVEIDERLPVCVTDVTDNIAAGQPVGAPRRGEAAGHFSGVRRGQRADIAPLPRRTASGRSRCRRYHEVDQRSPPGDETASLFTPFCTPGRIARPASIFLLPSPSDGGITGTLPRLSAGTIATPSLPPSGSRAPRLPPQRRSDGWLQKREPRGWRPRGSARRFAIGRASRRLIEISSPVSSQ